LTDLFLEKSTTYKMNGALMQIKYGSGKMKGIFAKDNVFIGNLKAQNFIFSEAVELDGKAFEAGRFDGIVGLGFPRIAVNNVENIITTLKKQGTIKKAVFSFFLTHDAESGSKLIIGGDSEKYFKGPIKYYPLTDETYWIVDMGGILVGDKKLDIKFGKFILDSGTSLIVGDRKIVTELSNEIGKVESNCSNFDKLKDIHFVIGDDKYTLSPNVYVVKFSNGFEDKCELGIVPMDMPVTNGLILGDEFMKVYYTEFDLENKRIGLAKSINYS
jgi:hypothetical protein